MISYIILLLYNNNYIKKYIYNIYIIIKIVVDKVNLSELSYNYNYNHILSYYLLTYYLFTK